MSREYFSQLEKMGTIEQLPRGSVLLRHFSGISENNGVHVVNTILYLKRVETDSRVMMQVRFFEVDGVSL